MSLIGWKDCLLGDLIELKRGYDLPTQARKVGPFPIVSSSGITGYHVEAKVQAPGVVTGRYGTLGEVFYIQESFWPLNTSLYVCDFKGNNPRFISYLLSSLDLGRNNSAGAVPGLNRNHLHDLKVSAPRVDVQNDIASILAVYDDLVEVNACRIKIIEEMAQRLYEEWFVHFRFPGHEGVAFKESELGLIPAGWDVVTLKSAVDINPKTKVEREGEKIFVPMGALSESSMVISGFDVKSGNSGAKFQNDDTLVARISPCLENGKTGFVDFLPIDQPTACGSTEFIVLRSRSFCPEMVYSLARSERFRNIAMKSMSGATGRQRVRVESLCSLLVVQPDSELIERYRQFAQPCFKEVRVLANKNANLRAQRDLLLPKLISGEIDVSDIPTPN